MNECKNCKHEGEICPSVSHYQGFCEGWEAKPITNADKIRAMTDDELADWLDRIRRWCAAETCVGHKCPLAKICYSYAEDTLAWLKEETKQ